MKRQEIKDTLELLQEKGFTLCEIEYGWEDVAFGNTLDDALDAIMADDVTTLFLNKEGRNYWIDFCRDIAPGCSIGDYSISPELDDIVEEIHTKYC